MRNQIFSIAFAISSVAFFTSCNKEDVRTSKPESQPIVTVTEGRLKFETDADFQQTIAALRARQNSLSQWESNIGGYTSMKTAYNNLTDNQLQSIIETNSIDKYRDIISVVGEGDDKELVMNIDDPILATLVNEKGLIQIGNNVYKISYQTVAKAAEHELHKLQKNYNRKTGAANGVEVSNVSHSYSKNTQAGINDECNNEYRMSGGIGGIKKRLVGELYTTQVGPLYSSAGALSKHQQRILGVWLRKRTSAIQLKVVGEFTQYLNGAPIVTENVNYDSGQQTDDGREAYSFEFCVNANCQFTINNATSYHWARCDDGQQRSCTISR